MQRRRIDILGGMLAVLLVLGLTVLVAVQAALARPDWRYRLSLIDRFEGLPLAEADRAGKDLPSMVSLW